MAKLCAGEVVQHDLLVADALLRVPVSAVLAHPDAVSPAVARDDERRGAGGSLRVYARMGHRTDAEQENGGDRDGSTHRSDPSEDLTRLAKGPMCSMFFYGNLT